MDAGPSAGPGDAGGRPPRTPDQAAQYVAPAGASKCRDRRRARQGAQQKFKCMQWTFGLPWRTMGCSAALRPPGAPRVEPDDAVELLPPARTGSPFIRQHELPKGDAILGQNLAPPWCAPARKRSDPVPPVAPQRGNDFFIGTMVSTGASTPRGAPSGTALDSPNVSQRRTAGESDAGQPDRVHDPAGVPDDGELFPGAAPGAQAEWIERRVPVD